MGANGLPSLAWFRIETKRTLEKVTSGEERNARAQGGGSSHAQIPGWTAISDRHQTGDQPFFDIWGVLFEHCSLLAVWTGRGRCLGEGMSAFLAIFTAFLSSRVNTVKKKKKMPSVVARVVP